jgi:small subunit ribosomal protein S9
MSAPYYSATGKRKSAIVRVWLYPRGKGRIEVNEQSLQSYFFGDLVGTVRSPITMAHLDSSCDVLARAKGGGKRGQAEAMRLAISRALLLFNPDLRTTLKHAGLLKRDPRIKERKKPGRHRARRGHQYSKR